ncbi:capsule biosynthesis protein [Falsirhodobacter deserti]|uniref:capsule biosynthesis protein n=1 Tax=Falsirhodobacter deserti TaxID=1365611 RepID=UPI000FE3FBA9|nr:capsule biosynthesis protein [Falsirhodobacter deserti]
MTTKLTARRFRTRPSQPAQGDHPVSQVPPEELFPEADDGLGAGVNRRQENTAATDHRITAEEIAAVEGEGLTGRQLRLARRIAAKQNIQASSDVAAVVLLRRAGIDPFQRASLMDLVVSSRQGEAEAPTNLPQRIQPIQVPSTEQRARDSHLNDLREIQRDIARRRRRKLTLLFARLAFFVLLPTIIAGYYFYNIATPLYSAKSEFVIQQSENPTTSGGLGGMVSGPSLSALQDSIAVQGYLQSREAMTRLNEDLGFREHFSAPSIDVLQRLPADATMEDVYNVYEKNVKISFDPTEGIMKMEVIAEDSPTAVAFSEALIGYAEEQVDQLTARMREDQMAGALQGYQDAEAAVLRAQMNLVDLQERFSIISSDVEVNLITSQLAELNSQLMQDRLSLAQIEANPQPNEARMQPLRERIARLQEQAQSLRAQLTNSANGDDSLARLQAQLAVAQADVETRQAMLAQSLQAMETARVEAARQTRYLSRSVNPVVSDAPVYPRAFENTLVSLLVFLGIYLMISMTVAILREQVSS